jgi:acyl-CoA synthetase (AMP-forming)/AMP-acid ligase II
MPYMLTWLAGNAAEDAIAVERPDGAAMRWGDLALAVRELGEALIAACGSLAGRAVDIAVEDPAGALVSALAVLEVGAVPSLGGPAALKLVTAPDDRVELAAPAALSDEVLAPDIGLRAAGLALGGRGLQHILDAAGARLALGPGRRLAVPGPLTRLSSLVGVLTSLRAGAATLLLDEAPLASARLGSADGLWAPAHRLRRLAGSPPSDAGFYVASGPLPALGALFPRARAWRRYGLVETSAVVGLLGDDDPAFGEGAVARPLPGVVARASDGRILVAGPGVHLGVNELDTGDLGEIIDGAIFVRGRADDQVKVAGTRVSLAAVEATLGVPVIAARTPDGERRLIAFVDERSVDAAAVRARAETLPVRPAKIVTLDGLPRSGGTVDREALRRMFEI